MANIFVGVVAWLAIAVFSPDSEANNKADCAVYKVVSSTFVGGKVSRQWKIIWKSERGGKITFEKYPQAKNYKRIICK